MIRPFFASIGVWAACAFLIAASAIACGSSGQGVGRSVGS